MKHFIPSLLINIVLFHILIAYIFATLFLISLISYIIVFFFV